MKEVEDEFGAHEFEICKQHKKIIEKQLMGPQVTDCGVGRSTGRKRSFDEVMADEAEDDNLLLHIDEDDDTDIEEMVSRIANSPSIPSLTSTPSSSSTLTASQISTPPTGSLPPTAMHFFMEDKKKRKSRHLVFKEIFKSVEAKHRGEIRKKVSV